MGAARSTKPRLVRDQHSETVLQLRRLLGDTDVDDQAEIHHGLAWWYPQVKLWPTVRSVGGAGGSRSAPLPMNAEALDFVGGTYWAAERPMPQAKTDRDVHELADPANYRAGFELTALGLERSCRRALGHTRAPGRPPARGPLAPSPVVTAALSYLYDFAPEVAGQHFLLELVRAEAIRLIVRARGMMHGSRWSAGRGPCMHCHQPESVISDEDRAVCITPICRTTTGERHCWRIDPDTQQWVAVPEPDMRGRGQVSDATLSRWTDTA